MKKTKSSTEDSKVISHSQSEGINGTNNHFSMQKMFNEVLFDKDSYLSGYFKRNFAFLNPFS